MDNPGAAGHPFAITPFEDASATVLADYDTAIGALYRLRTAALAGDERLTGSASQLLDLLARRSRDVAHTASVTGSSGRYPMIRAISRRVETPLSGGFRHLRPLRVHAHGLLVGWSSLALGLAFATSATIVAQRWLLAFALLAARAAGAVMAGTARYPVSDRERRPYGEETPRSWVERCVASHLGDVMCLLGIAVRLSLSDRSMWAMATTGVALIVLTATLTRVAAVQVGAVIHRKGTERIARRASLGLALLAVAIHQPHIPTAGIPWLFIASVGPLGYALVELWCTHQRLGELSRDAVVSLNVESPGRPDIRRTMWPSEPQSHSELVGV